MPTALSALSPESSEHESSQDELDGLTSPSRTKRIETSEGRRTPTHSKPHKLEAKVRTFEIEGTKWISKPESSSHLRSDQGARPPFENRQSSSQTGVSEPFLAKLTLPLLSNGSGQRPAPSVSTKYQRPELPGFFDAQNPSPARLAGIMKGSDPVSITHAKPWQKPIFDGVEIPIHRPKVHLESSSKAIVIGRVADDASSSLSAVKDGEYTSPPLDFPSSSPTRGPTAFRTPLAPVLVPSASNLVPTASISTSDSLTSLTRTKFIGVVIPTRSGPLSKTKATSSYNDPITATTKAQPNQNSLLTALSNTFLQNIYTSTTFQPAPQDARQPSIRGVKPGNTSGTHPNFGHAAPPPSNEKDNRKISLTEATIDALLDTRMAPIGVRSSVGGASSSEVRQRKVEPELDVGRAGVQLSSEGESAEVTDRRVRMNVRFLWSDPAIPFDSPEVIASASTHNEGMAGVGREGRYIATHPRETPNGMFVNRLQGMFGSGSVGRGGVGKPKAKVSNFSFVTLGFPVFPSLSRARREGLRVIFVIPLVVGRGMCILVFFSSFARL